MKVIIADPRDDGYRSIEEIININPELYPTGRVVIYAWLRVS